MHDIGLPNRAGGAVSLNGLSRLLRNSFYVGIISWLDLQTWQVREIEAGPPIANPAT